MSELVVGLLHPGDMGSSVGAAAAANGARVLWASPGRSDASAARARAAGFADAGDLASLLAASGLVISLCPPDAALAQARAVAGEGFQGLYLDANAVSAATAERIGEAVSGAGADYVDGGIIGPPARKAGTTRLYLSGPRAGDVAALFSGSLVDPHVIGEAPGAASALKMSYAAWTKGSDALLLALRALAAARGVEDALLAEWALSQPGLAERCERAARMQAPKAWRFAGEMREIAASFEAAGLPDGFHRAATEVYEALSGFKDRTDARPELDEVLAALLTARRP